MNQSERRCYLISYLLSEQGIGQAEQQIPQDSAAQKRLLRDLFKVRPARSASEEFLRIQDAYLATEIASKGIQPWQSLTPIQPGIYLWKGDTTLASDAIVNAANDQLLGCFVSNHTCIDNAIHTFAGIQLRQACASYMANKGYLSEPCGKAVFTDSYNLPSRYVIHTVGPAPQGIPSAHDDDLLASCYHSCMQVALDAHLASIAFCCISTGVFGFPRQRAALIAIKTVQEFRSVHPDAPQVVFNVFTEEDYELYARLLG